MYVLSLIPSHDIANANFIQSSEDGNGREDQRGNDGLYICKHFEEGFLLQPLSANPCCAQSSRLIGSGCLSITFFASFFLSSGWNALSEGAPGEATCRFLKPSPRSAPEARAAFSAAMVPEDNFLLSPEVAGGRKESIELIEEKNSKQREERRIGEGHSRPAPNAAQFVMTGRVWGTQTTITSTTATTRHRRFEKGEKEESNNPQGQVRLRGEKRSGNDKGGVSGGYCCLRRIFQEYGSFLKPPWFS